MDNLEPINGQIELPRDIAQITAEVKYLKASAGQAILEIGNRLIEAKAQLNQGEWLSWLQDEVQFSVRTAQRMMQIANEYSDASLVSHLGYSKALQLLALPDFQREQFLEEKHEVDGVEKSVYEMTKRELEAALKEKTDLQDQVDAYNQHAEELEDKVEALQAKIKMLEEHPKEVKTVEVVKDEAAEQKLKDEIEKLKQEAADNKLKAEKSRSTAESLQKKLDASAKEKEQAVKDAAADAQKKASAQTEKMQNEIDSLRKQVKESGNSAVAVFKVHFQAFQTEAGEMKKCIDSIEDEEMKNKLIAAYRAVVEAMGKAL